MGDLRLFYFNILDDSYCFLISYFLLLIYIRKDKVEYDFTGLLFFYLF